MSKLSIAGGSAVLLLTGAVPQWAEAQAQGGATVVSGYTCPTSGTTVVNVGNNRPLIETQNGALCTNGSGGGGGGGGGGPVTIAAGAVSSGAYVAGSILDGAIVTLGTLADNPWTGSGSGSLIAISKDMANIMAGPTPSGSNYIGQVGISGTTTVNGVVGLSAGTSIGISAGQTVSVTNGAVVGLSAGSANIGTVGISGGVGLNAGSAVIGQVGISGGTSVSGTVALGAGSAQIGTVGISGSISGQSGALTAVSATCATSSTVILSSGLATSFIELQVAGGVTYPEYVAYNGTAAVNSAPSEVISAGQTKVWGGVGGFLPTGAITCIASASQPMTVIYK